ncbi:MAG: TlpA family protein disulfide reductase [Bacteroidales bacterium]|nr:TlpA family protein disulfide reductase [Bacteroidales bacterium]
MRKLAFMLAIVMSLVACAGGREGNIVLEVDVVNQASKEVVLVYHDQILTVELDSQGHAEFVIDDEDAIYARICHYPFVDQMKNVYLERGDRAYVTFSGKDFNGTFAFEGEKEPAVKYLNTVVLTALPDEDYALPFDDYVKKLEKKEADAVKLLQASGVSKAGDFEEIEKGRIRYSYATQLLMYPLGHRFMTHDMDYQMDQKYYDVLDSYMVAEDVLAELDQYREFIAEAAHVLDADNRDETAAYPRAVAQMRFIADRFEAGKARDVLLHRLAYAYVNRFGTDDIQDMENIYRTYVQDPLLIAKYDMACEKWNQASVGKLSPDFKGVDVNGKEYTLADFRGKYVYIDVWATWCGPCRQEIPYLKKLDNDYKDAQIVFLSLSVDQDKAKWEKMVKEEAMSGVQLHIGQNSSFQQAYRIEGIPHFILLDKEGKILDMKMSRPSMYDATRGRIDNLEGIR